ncbi:Pleiotropic drug resistance protein 1 [Phytophthora citrophthora]|uniref:Pleiotropic drug resistance protein 1 n=1 Tax=Phytophthora citrophthora TaxID=4793 RepID=A0AAD9LHZ5_9STRA|nr:Pleiotropic drug resistance protein 1 [Phytophthora citrophthora]
MNSTEKETSQSNISYDNGETLMANGSLALHDHVASRLERALGKSLPQVEVRFENLSISAQVVVQTETQQVDLPTLPNVAKTGVLQLLTSKNRVEKEILHPVSGVLKPSTLTLVLGQPGSGKSTLMKILSGRFPVSKNVAVEGKVTYNGTSQEELRSKLPQFVSYVPQHDKHLARLSVKETLKFAHACNGLELSKTEEKQLVFGSEEENKVALEAARALRKHYPDVVLRQLGLDNCQNTIVGNEMLRGISGGERKRVTTGEMAFGNNHVMFMDEISTGLDSAATLDIVSTLRSLAKQFRRTVVVSLLQPSPEVFTLFDDVMLLNEGYMMYHGPRDQALNYFESLGFQCPPRRDVADFLLDLGTNKQLQYQVGSVPTTPDQFREAFEQSSIFQHQANDLRSPVLPQEAVDFAAIPEFHQSFWAGTSTLVKRELTLLLRDTNAFKGRLFMAILLGLLQGSTFYQFDDANSQVVMGIAFVTINFVATNHMALIPAVMAVRDVVYKQRGANFFRVSSYVIARYASFIPVGLMESLVFGSFMYWMSGFVPTVGGFLLFELVLFFVSMAVAALFFFVACASPNLNVAFPITQLLQLFFVTFSGYVVTKDTIPDYMIWVYWLSPQGWGVRALAVNQYNDSRFMTCVYEGVDYCSRYGMQAGEYLLSVYGVPTQKYWLWFALVFLAALYLFVMLLSCLVLEFLRYEEPGTSAASVDSTGETSEDSYTLAKTPKQRESFVTIPHNHQNFVPVTLAFKDLWYSVPNPANPKEDIDLLKGISGFALPGTMTALMGSSGAGKTTLMDVIAGRKTGGKIRGGILLNGHPATELAIRRSTGYCEQMDIHSDSSTFREALTFSAFLRQGADIPTSQKFDSVTECLELLDLNPIADQIIRGSSMEQLKRLTIGVELAAQPSVLFLDEPTSGLDARSAKLIMDGVRKVADTGRTIVCTIHQPSTVVFQVFDSLLLLKRGGEMVFFGDLGAKSTELVDYFESIGGVEKLSPDYNPATWMLEVIGAGVGNVNTDALDFVSIFKDSEKNRQLQFNLDREGVTKPSPSLPALNFGRKRAASSLTQARFLIQRFFDLYWRTASYNMTRMIISVILGLLFGITYVGVEYSSYQGLNSGMGMIFMAASYITFITLSGVLPITYQERAVFYRERAGQTYSAFWYFIGETLVEIPYCFIATLIFLIIFYPMVGFTGVSNFFTFWFCLALLVLLQAYLGQLLIYTLPGLDVASVFGLLINNVLILFTGMNPPAASLPRGYVWLYHAMPNKYTFASLTAIVFAACEDGNGPGCAVMTGTPPTLADGTTVEQYMDNLFWIKHSEIWSNCGYVVAWIVLLRGLALVVLRYVNHTKR